MHDWISCSEELPPKGVLVEIKRQHGDSRRAFVKGIFRKRWVYPSGLSNWYVAESDYWRPILVEKQENKNE